VNYLRHLPISWRIVLGYLLTDEAWAMSMRRFRSQPASPVMHYHLLGAGVTLWVCWQVSTLAGVLLGATIPEELQLGFAVPLTFIALIVPALKKRAEILAALSAGLAALLLQDLPFNLWLIASALIGIGVGMGAGQFDKPRADR
jgi:predicted branched-subunit amino acid permease